MAKKKKLSEKPKYLVLGAGSFGFNVAKELMDSGFDVVIVDVDEKRIESLRDQNFEAILGDIKDEKLFKELKLSEYRAVLVMTPDMEANKSAIRAIKNVYPDVVVIARASNPASEEELRRLGADDVVLPPVILAKYVLHAIEKTIFRKSSEELREVISEIKNGILGIVLHDNPDPDAMASGMALKRIAEHFGVKAEILYGGTIGHQENRAMVNLLDVDLKPISKIDVKSYEKLALVDCSIPGRYNSLPSNTPVSIVIDHHPVETENISAEFIDVRSDVGATSTILTKYLQEMNIPVDKTLATALMYGIRTDTNNFRRNVFPADFSAAAFLHPFVNQEILDQLTSPDISTETLDVIGEAIKNRKLKGSILITTVGMVRDRDALTQAADYLLRLEGITTVLVIGISEEKILVCARNRDIRLNIGEVVARAYADIGSAGGHAHAAAAEIPLGIFGDVRDKEMLMKIIAESVAKRFLAAVGVEKIEE